MAGLAIMLAALYATTIKGLALEWASSPDSSHGLILAAVALVLVWKRRHALASAMSTAAPSMAGLALLFIGLIAYLVGQLGADVFATRLSLVIVFAGCVWWILGRDAARLTAVPLFFLLLAIPLPALIVNAITLPLQLVASRIAEGLLAAGNVPVFRDGNVLELRSTTLEVAQACSGLRSLISLTAIGCLVAWATESSLVRRAAVVAACVPIAIALNGVRIAATGVACELWGPSMATGARHEFAGWVTFSVAVGVLVAFQRTLPKTGRAAVARMEAATI